MCDHKKTRVVWPRSRPDCSVIVHSVFSETGHTGLLEISFGYVGSELFAGNVSNKSEESFACIDHVTLCASLNRSL